MRALGARRRPRHRPSRASRERCFGALRAGGRTTWTSADKDGFGTAIGRPSRVWFTLSHAALIEVYYPRLDAPSVRDLELVVGDGRGEVCG